MEGVCLQWQDTPPVTATGGDSPLSEGAKSRFLFMLSKTDKHFFKFQMSFRSRKSPDQPFGHSLVCFVNALRFLSCQPVNCGPHQMGGAHLFFVLSQNRIDFFPEKRYTKTNDAKR